ncbi:Septin 4, partial [Rhizopus stolonifer]
MDDQSILSMEDSMMQTTKHQPVFRIIICGDSGIGKSALVQALTSTEIGGNISLEPIETYANNLCVIDTCGYGAMLRCKLIVPSSSSFNHQAEVVFHHVKSYIEAQFEKTNQLLNPVVKEEDRLMSVLQAASHCFTHVDICLYLIMGRLKPVDIEYMRTIHDVVNIVPVIIQTDLTLRPEQMTKQQTQVLDYLETNHIKHFKKLFVLDWSSTSRSFHGVLSLRQHLLQQHQHLLREATLQKFIVWKRQQASLIKKNKIRISQYVSDRRHNMEKELLIQEKKLRQEFETASRQKKMEFILREANQLLVAENEAQFTTRE